MVDKFDVIIVGAGPGGAAAALYLSRRGYDVLILEKSKVPGHRNVTGGVLFGHYLDHYGLADLIPGFENEAPLERKISDHQVYILSNPSMNVDERSYKQTVVSKDSLISKCGLVNTDISTGADYTILRVPFDRWFASKAVEAGAMMATEIAVEDLLFDGKKVIGVKTVKEEIYSDMVIDSSGVTSNLSEKAGLRKRLEFGDVYHGVKHIYFLGEDVINERFGIRSGEGKAIVALGEFMQGVKGGAFLYTNKNTLSVGIVSPLDSILKNALEKPENLGKPIDLVENFEMHPMISRIIEGAVLKEYSAHNIPKGPKSILSQPYTDGFMAVGDALGSFVKIGPMIDGIRRAIATGIMAGEAYLSAKKSNDFSSKTLSNYKQLLSPIYRDVRRSSVDSYLFESGFVYNFLPKVMFALGIMVKSVRITEAPNVPDKRDVIQRIQERTGLLDYDEDKERSHIQVNYELCNKSESKGWIPTCPFNCYTLVLDKGVFASFKDLYNHNLDLLSVESGKRTSTIKSKAKRMTKEDIIKGQVRFDHVACVGCGTCGIIEPPGAVLFGHENSGYGVQYRYG